MSKVEYRNDIQGLRAVAVLAILLFHIDPRFSGGFIGVDIFFVISGFLITGIIWRDIQTNNFSISIFYLKRIRRLFPALFVMLVAIFFLVIFFGLKDEVEMYGKSALSSLCYISNIFFYTQNDYFSSDLELNPLLHTWSLSVEEQFYLLFPFFMIIAYKTRINIKKILLVSLFTSFILSEFMLLADESAAFFLSPSRFWQFLTGSIIAICYIQYPFPKWVYKYFSYIGVGLISISLAVFSKETIFPGMMALLPTLGTALLIISGRDKTTLTYMALSSKPSIFLGNISYSLYLWHWPLIVLYKLNINPSPRIDDKIILFVISLLAGFLSWKYIEKSTSGITLKKNKGLIVKYSILSVSLLTVLFSISTTSPDLFIDKDRERFSTFLEYDIKARRGKCFLYSGADDSNLFDENLCIKTGTSENVLLIGDSHAAHYYNPLITMYPNTTFSQATSSGCKPTINLEGQKRCTGVMERVFNQIIIQQKFDTIILAARWQVNDSLHLNETIKYLEDKVSNIIVIGPVIEYEQPLPKLLSRFGSKQEIESPMIANARKWGDRLPASKAISKACIGTNAKFISAIDRMCPDNKCITVFNNNPVQFDYGHLTYDGATLILRNLL